MSASTTNSSASIGVDGLAVSSPFDLKDRTVLVTGGGSGIGLAFVEQFIKYGVAKIIITGRRESVLKEAQKKYPNHIVYYVSDAGNESDREELFAKVSKEHPQLSVVMNNAGIQRRVALPADTSAWKERQAEIDINFSAPVHLSSLFAPLLLKQKNGGAIIQISSGLAFIPFEVGAVYSASKAALHNFTIAQRISFEGSPVRVVEIVPPAVRSNLGGAHDFGEDPVEFASSVFARWTAGELEVGFKSSENFRLANRQQVMQIANGLTKTFNPPKYHAQSQ